MTSRAAAAVVLVALAGSGCGDGSARKRGGSDAGAERADPSAECRAACQAVRERGCPDQRVDYCVAGCLLGELVRSDCRAAYRELIVCTAALDLACTGATIDPGACGAELARSCACTGCDGGPV